MDFKKLKDGLVFDKESGLIGKALEVNLSENAIILVGEEKEVFIADLENVELLEYLGAIGEDVIFNHDVIMDTADQLFEIEKADGEFVTFFKINEKLERTSSGQKVSKHNLHVFDGHVVLVGNLYTLEPEEEDVVDFNIKIVREISSIGEFVGYHYACNDKINEQVDIIKVVFVGHHLLEEEEYERVTLTYEQYLSDVKNGNLVEVNPQELMNYVTGMSYQSNVVEDEVEEDEFECECECDGFCDDCNCEEGKDFIDDEDEDDDEDCWEEKFWKDDDEEDIYEDEDDDEDWK